MPPQTEPHRSRARMFLGRGMNDAVAHAPWLWPLLRAPMRSFFDRGADGWDERTGAGSVDHLAALATALLEVKPAPERALDLGTGTGEAALLLAREFPRASVRGVDVSPEMIAAARRKVGLDPEGRIAFKVADAASLPWPPESFDLVTQLNVPPFFKAIATVLRPGGYVAISASWGVRTPFYTPEPVLIKRFKRHGIAQVRSGATGPGTWWVGRREAAPPEAKPRRWRRPAMGRRGS